MKYLFLICILFLTACGTDGKVVRINELSVENSELREKNAQLREELDSLKEELNMFNTSTTPNSSAKTPSKTIYASFEELIAEVPTCYSVQHECFSCSLSKGELNKNLCIEIAGYCDFVDGRSCSIKMME